MPSPSEIYPPSFINILLGELMSSSSFVALVADRASPVAAEVTSFVPSEIPSASPWDMYAPTWFRQTREGLRESVALSASFFACSKILRTAS